MGGITYRVFGQQVRPVQQGGSSFVKRQQRNPGYATYSLLKSYMRCLML